MRKPKKQRRWMYGQLSESAERHAKQAKQWERVLFMYFTARNDGTTIMARSMARECVLRIRWHRWCAEMQKGGKA